MKKIIIAVVVVIVAGIIFVPKLAHTCADCDKFFIGTGYEPNVVVDIIAKEERIICKDCAEIHHAISIATGTPLDDFKRDLF